MCRAGQACPICGRFLPQLRLSKTQSNDTGADQNELIDKDITPQRLSDLRNKGLINEAEYQEKRKGWIENLRAQVNGTKRTSDEEALI
jgi:hypothetical protein